MLNLLRRPSAGRIPPSCILSSRRSLATIPHTWTLEGQSQTRLPNAHTMPPTHHAKVGNLTTFDLPCHVNDTDTDRALGKRMVQTWRKDGIFQVQLTLEQATALRNAFQISKAYFAQPFAEKAKDVDDQSFSGYIASGEELTDGIADYSEIFTITKDLPLSDPRVQQRWPCHGPCPWSNRDYEAVTKSLMELLGECGEKILQLTALGLKVENKNVFKELTDDGWHHMRVLRFPQVNETNGKGKAGRGIGSHTDYGLLVLAGQDDVGGLFIRPPIEGETVRNWEKSAAGHQENDHRWTYVPPVEGVLKEFKGI